MSADNGIYILKTKMPGDKPPYFIYRVVHAQAIDNLYYDVETGEHNENFTTEEAYSYFKECMPFFDEGEALCYAHKLADQHPILEYGVCILDHGEQTFETFTEEEMQAYYQKIDETIEAHRQQRDVREQAQREAATLNLGEGVVFKPRALYGCLIKEDGTEVHGSLSGIGTLTIASEHEIGEPAHKAAVLEGDGIDLQFLPSDWHKG